MDRRKDHSARILRQISDVSEAEWDAHLPSVSHPFLSWRFLHALEESEAKANMFSTMAGPMPCTAQEGNITPSCNVLSPLPQPQDRDYSAEITLPNP